MPQERATILIFIWKQVSPPDFKIIFENINAACAVDVSDISTGATIQQTELFFQSLFLLHCLPIWAAEEDSSMVILIADYQDKIRLASLDHSQIQIKTTQCS